MPLRVIRRSAVLSCTLLYCAMFLVARYGLPSERESQPALLLFLLPGILAALTTGGAACAVALLGGALATPLCLALLVPLLSAVHFWQELAWQASALFLCVCGALLVLLWRRLLTAACVSERE